MRLLIVFLFFSLGILAQEVTDLKLQILGQKKEAVIKNGRLELGLTLPDSILHEIATYLTDEPFQRGGLNPFVSWDVDVRAEFSHKSDNYKFTAVGFWYADIKRNTRKDTWESKNTDLPFRIRYAPPSIGEWDVVVSVRIRHQNLIQLAPLAFTVIDSEMPGYVTYNNSKNLLERDGKSFFPAGINLPGPYNQNNVLYDWNPDAKLNLSAWTEYMEQVTDYVNQGGETFRMFINPSCTDIEFEEVGFYQDRQNFAWEMDQLLSFCESKHVLIQLNLMYHTLFMKLGDYYQFKYDYTDYWYNGEKLSEDDPNYISGYSKILNSKTPSDMFLDPIGMRYLKEKTRYIMARWGYSTSISMIELMSEPWHIDQNPYFNEFPYDEVSQRGDVARKAVYYYHKEIANYIKDTLHYRQHLLSAIGRFPVGSSHIYSHLTEETPAFVDSTWYIPNIDIIAISYYTSSPEKMIFSKSGSNNECGGNENAMPCTIKRLKDTYGKPVIFGESDDGDDTYFCSDYQGHYINLMRSPFTGMIGHYLWDGFVEDTPKDGIPGRNGRKSWAGIISIQNYVNQPWYYDLWRGSPVLGHEKGDFQRSPKDRVEHQYIISQNKETVGGYVYNRTYNIATALGKSNQDLKGTPCDFGDTPFTHPVTIPWKPKKLKIEGLKAMKKYEIIFYNYKTGSLHSNVLVRSTIGGKLKLEHPPLIPSTDGTPLLWYKVNLIK